jgi:outer membrane murein-binding lipoprotein Lpp
MDEQQLQSTVPNETHNTPPQNARQNPEKSKKKLPLVILAILLIGGSFAGAYFWQQSKIDDLATKLTASEAKVTELEKQVTEASTKTTEADSDSTKVAATEYFEIEQLGVKFKTNPTLKNLYYSIGNDGKTAYFSLTELSKTDCAADKTSQIALSRYTDTDFETDQQASPQKSTAKKIGNYYFFDTSGQAMCSENASEQAKASAMKTEISKLLPDALEAIN